MSSRPAILATLTLAIVYGLASASALAVSEDATLNASFKPDQLGTPTTITFGFTWPRAKERRRRR
jgi:hypothetical protein